MTEQTTSKTSEWSIKHSTEIAPTPTLEHLANEIKAQSWNECISPQLESIRQWFNMEQWTQGVGAYLQQVQERLLDNMLKPNQDEKLIEYTRGQIAILREVLQFPETVRRQIDNKAKQVQQPRPTGEAGY